MNIEDLIEVVDVKVTMFGEVSVILTTLTKTVYVTVPEKILSEWAKWANVMGDDIEAIDVWIDKNLDYEHAFEIAKFSINYYPETITNIL